MRDTTSDDTCQGDEEMTNGSKAGHCWAALSAITRHLRPPAPRAPSADRREPFPGTHHDSLRAHETPGALVGDFRVRLLVAGLQLTDRGDRRPSKHSGFVARRIESLCQFMFPRRNPSPERDGNGHVGPNDRKPHRDAATNDSSLLSGLQKRGHAADCTSISVKDNVASYDDVLQGAGRLDFVNRQKAIVRYRKGSINLAFRQCESR